MLKIMAELNIVMILGSCGLVIICLFGYLLRQHVKGCSCTLHRCLNLLGKSIVEVWCI